MGLPKRARGRLSKEAEEAYQADVRAFCAQIIQIRSSLDFEVSSRGWCYILEGQIGLGKGEFDDAQKLINDCRKDGKLPIDICAEDGSRATVNLEEIDTRTPEDEALDWRKAIENAHNGYTPFSFWENQEYYLEMWVEKIDLRSLFLPVCERFRVPIANVKGWCDINSRAAVMQRFAYWQAKGKKCVLLYCGDHDPAGLKISGTIRSNLRDVEPAVKWDPSDLIIDRFGLNISFIEEQGLTWIDNLETARGRYHLDDPLHDDHRKQYVQEYIAQYGARKCEANALVIRPDAGRQLCLEAIQRYVNDSSVTEYEAALQVQREKVREYITRMLPAWFQ
jgi:hypothetical protein